MAKFACLLLALMAFAVPPPQTPAPTQHPDSARTGAPFAGVAEVYFWKAKPGKLDEYNRYIREVAEPIDMDARSHGAFVSVTTYANPRPDAPWTHMRVFQLRDRAQQAGLSAALDAAKLRLHPDEAERARLGSYGESLRDAAGHETVDIMP